MNGNKVLIFIFGAIWTFVGCYLITEGVLGKGDYFYVQIVIGVTILAVSAGDIINCFSREEIKEDAETPIIKNVKKDDSSKEDVEKVEDRFARRENGEGEQYIWAARFDFLAGCLKTYYGCYLYIKLFLYQFGWSTLIVGTILILWGALDILKSIKYFEKEKQLKNKNVE